MYSNFSIKARVTVYYLPSLVKVYVLQYCVIQMFISEILSKINKYNASCYVTVSYDDHCTTVELVLLGLD